MKTTKQHILDVLFWGFLIGVPLGIAAYLFLSFQGARIAAQDFADTTDRLYSQKASKDVYIGSVDFIDSDRDTLIPAYGFRIYQPTYDPQAAEDVTFNELKVNYKGVTL